MPTYRADDLREIPPTAGLPLALSDLLAFHPNDFPQKLAEFLGVTEVGLECSGTASLVVILKALHRRTGRRKVVIPAYTCPLVPLAIAHCGLQTVLCDVVPGGLAMAPAQLAELCDSDTLAVIPTHLAGRIVEIGRILDIARAAGAFVVEDAAQAFGARHDRTSVGLTGDAGFFSFAAGKGLSIFEGGAWISRDETLRAELAEISRQSIFPQAVGEFGRCLQLIGYAAFYRPRWLYYFYGIPLRQALKHGDPATAVGDVFAPGIPLHRVSAWRQAVGCRGLARLPGFLSALEQQAAPRIARLSALPGIQVFGDSPGDRGVWPFLMLTMPNEAARDAALRELWTAGLGVTRLFIHALTDYPYLRPWVESRECPNARDLAARSLTISNSLWLEERQFERVVTVLQHSLG